MSRDNITEGEIHLAIQTADSGTTTGYIVRPTPVMGHLVKEIVALGMQLEVLEQGGPWHN
jgi:hypothetical protein